MQVTWEDFQKIDMRVGTIVSAEPFAEARKPAYRMQIDFGGAIGVLASSAQVTVHYSAGELAGRQVIAVVNFPPKRIAGFISQCLVLGLYDENHDVILLQPERKLPNGCKVG
jgi:tRNA-binding protein